MDSPDFLWLLSFLQLVVLHMWVLSYSSWFWLASTTHLIQIRSGAEHWIPFLLFSSLHELSPGLYGFLHTTPIQIRS